jgi:hypothetical protein
MDPKISIVIEIPETLHDRVQAVLKSRNNWDQDRVFEFAVAAFLMRIESETAKVPCEVSP